MKKKSGPINVLFVCEHNSARSILAEALLNRLGAGRFEACSAGFDPVSDISPYARAMLHRMPYNTGWVSTKPVEAHIGKHAPVFDVIIRLSHGHPAGGQWPACRGGQPVIVDWFFDDPRETHVAMANIARAYEEIYIELAARIDALSKMPHNLFESGNVAGWLERMDETPLRMAS
ncbi:MULTISPECIES: low molecular weight phosphatase family protein [Asticcacaulis]|uniref:arsenate-mycothiol transferase ArsC n=1 Tax=Asticcacaulis TaxID=76890 RepID=UPI001AEA2D47|nr:MULTISPECIES: arsenate reductase ArsC [Asticcacaulis]MBP2157850.1 arsenate reductase [Asticcacaulis solisilvae]MDR6798895.1 arsenate reductase [Asticcacaulis sp. BE141]